MINLFAFVLGFLASFLGLQWAKDHQPKPETAYSAGMFIGAAVIVIIVLTTLYQ